MARHPTAKRVHRPEADADDAFVARMLELSGWAKRNARVVVGVAIGAAFLVLGYLYYTNRRARLDQLAASQLLEVRQTVASGNYPLATRDLQQFVDRYGKTDAGREGRLLLGQLQLEQGKAQDAIRDLTSFAPRDALIDSSRLLLLGAAYEQAGDTARAITTYAQVGRNGAFAFQRREGLENAARIHMQAGDYDAAASIYQQLVELVGSDDAQASVYRMRLAEAEGKAAGKPGGATKP